MNADAFRHLYEYHFAENRKLWGYLNTLSEEKFTQPIEYSIGCVKNQMIHLMNVDNVWFSPLYGQEPEWREPEEFADRAQIRMHWDKVEQEMRDYLSTLKDEMLMQKPFQEGEDKDLILWQVLLHVVNHGTDHRAQILRLLHDLGVETIYQDYVFYAYGHPIAQSSGEPR